MHGECLVGRDQTIFPDEHHRSSSFLNAMYVYTSLVLLFKSDISQFPRNEILGMSGILHYTGKGGCGESSVHANGGEEG